MIIFYHITRFQAKHQQDLERRTKQTSVAEKKLHKEISLKQECERKSFDMNRKKEYKASKERWKRELSMDESTPKRQRDLTLQSQKDNQKKVEAQEEQRLLTLQKQYIELEMRKFKRRRLVMLHELEDQLLRDVCRLMAFQLILFIQKFIYYFRNSQKSSSSLNKHMACC